MAYLIKCLQHSGGLSRRQYSQKQKELFARSMFLGESDQNLVKGRNVPEMSPTTSPPVII